MNEYFKDLFNKYEKSIKLLDDRIESTSVSKNDKKRIRKQEANHVSSLMKIWKDTSWNTQDNLFYMIPHKWFSKWKNYINSDEINTPESSSACSFHPGPITYNELLENDKEYLHNYSVPENERDKVVKASAEEGRDYFMSSEQLHNFLKERYGGTGICRYQVNIGYNGLRKVYPKLASVYY